MTTAKKLGEVSWATFTPDESYPSPRSGHSITCAPNGQTFIFGGCGVSDGGRTQETFSETWTLKMGDTPTWKLADVMGDIPPPRWRHTSTLLPDANSMLVFGGLQKRRRFNDVYVLTFDKLEWNIKECAGTPPHPRSHHTANLIEFEPESEEDLVKQKIAIVGGYGGPNTSVDFFMDVHFLELDTWTWVKVQNMRGPNPKPRSDHCSCFTRGILIVAGGRGWAAGKTDPGFYDDIHCLNIKKSALLHGHRTARDGHANTHTHGRLPLSAVTLPAPAPDLSSA